MLAFGGIIDIYSVQGYQVLATHTPLPKELLCGYLYFSNLPIVIINFLRLRYYYRIFINFLLSVNFM